jgi:cob(I)alamin adenosyltransferase
MSNQQKNKWPGQIQVYTGNSKGKTTAALGLAIRALGYGLKVGIIFFDKGGDYYHERKTLKQLNHPNLDFQAFGLPRMTGGRFRFDNLPGDIDEAENALKTAADWFKNNNFDLIILDEINTTIATDLLKLDSIVNLIKSKPEPLELILTGRYCPEEIIALADLVTEMNPIKHYMDKGLDARPGIEY